MARQLSILLLSAELYSNILVHTSIFKHAICHSASGFVKLSTHLCKAYKVKLKFIFRNQPKSIKKGAKFINALIIINMQV